MTTHCAHCSAAITAEGTKFCPYCGTILPVAPAAPTTLSGRFEALEEHADFQKFMRHEPSTAAHHASNAGGLVAGLVFLAIAIFVFAQFSKAADHAPAMFKLIPLAVLAIAGFIVLQSMGRAAKFSRAPMRKRPAVVVDERTKVSGGGNDTSARTEYFVTLEDKHGARRELKARENLAGQVSPGDMGVAYSKGSSLVAFKRIRL